MILKLNMSSETPIYVQLRNQIVLGIGRGELQLGEGLPTVRQLAQDVGVNTMTVNKAYTALKNEGYIEIDRRHGARVSPAVRLDGEGAADGRSGFPASNLKCRVRRYRAADRTARLPATLGDGLHGR
mgnify:CR=1 FL=1